MSRNKEEEEEETLSSSFFIYSVSLKISREYSFEFLKKIIGWISN